MAIGGEETVTTTRSLRRDLTVALLKGRLIPSVGYSHLGCRLSQCIAKLANCLRLTELQLSERSAIVVRSWQVDRLRDERVTIWQMSECS